jgi:hypothetical protein
MNEQNFNPKSSREETHIVEIVVDGSKAFKSTERDVTLDNVFLVQDRV